MGLPIRYSPSGHVIGETGPGFILRSDVDSQSQGSLTLTGSKQVLIHGLGGAPFRCSLENPKPELLYRARGFFNFASSDAARQNVEGLFFAAIDDPASTFNFLGSNMTLGVPGTAAAGITQVQFDTGYILGSAFPAAPIVASTPLLTVELRVSDVSATGNVDEDSGTWAALELIEMLAS